MDGSLAGHVAVVAGGTRAAGRGIAVELASAGAFVYVTGRSTRAAPSEMNRPETIEETVELIERAGGVGRAVRVDHLDLDQVSALAALIEAEHGRVDLLVNDIWGADSNIGEWGRPFWEQRLDSGIRMHALGAQTHLITSWRLGPLLAASGRALVVEVTDGLDGPYGGNLFYDRVKAELRRFAAAQNVDLAPFGGMAVAVTPGFLRSEAMLDRFGVTEETWSDGIATDPHFALSESPRYVGRAIASLSADPERRRQAGLTTASWLLAKHYGITDVDGSQPDWGRYFAEVVLGGAVTPAAYYRRVGP